MMKNQKWIIVMLMAIVPVLGAQARKLNDKVLNKPYIDNRLMHLGFSVGMHTLNLGFTNNGHVTENGEAWFAEQPGYDPGFCVNGLYDLRLSNNFAFRFSPGMYFGNRNVRFIDHNSGVQLRQNVKSTFLVFPCDIKFAAMRYDNMRPYISAGVMPAIDLGKKHNDYLKLKAPDIYLTAGFGCDLYLPYFKFVPEVKFCFGFRDILEHNRPDLADDPEKLKITESIAKCTSKMIVLTFYFE